MNTHSPLSPKEIAILAAIILCLAAVVRFAWPTGAAAPNGEACTQEAKLCPGGSSVGRTGPHCAFADCPVAQAHPSLDTSSWATERATGTPFSFRYPETLGTRYVSLAEWPPVLATTAKPSMCSTGGSPITAEGSTAQQTINGHTYCVTRQSEGAAGSTYTHMIYADERESGGISLSFTIRTVQCMNYDEPQQSACTKEQAGFSMDEIADAMMQSVNK